MLRMGAALVQPPAPSCWHNGLGRVCSQVPTGAEGPYGDERGSCNAWSSWLAESPPISSVLGQIKGLTPSMSLRRG